METSNSVKITAMVLITVVALALFATLIYFWVKPSQTVSVSGMSSVKAMPDLLTVYLDIETKGEDAKEAKDSNAEIVDAVTTSLVRLGLERKEITTNSFNVYPEYDWTGNERKITGYTASYVLKVQLVEGKMSKAGDVIDAGVDNGAGISYINFELSQELQNQYKKEALEKATQDARSKAEGIASGLGKEVGRVVSISSSDFGYYPWRM